MINCIAVDDEPPALTLIRKFVSDIPELNLSAIFSDPIAAQEYLREQQVDLLFLDIRMNDITGIDFLKNLPVQPMVVFTTAYKKYAVEGFELNAVDYLVKPFSRERFQKAVKKAIFLNRITRKDGPVPEEYLYVPVDYKLRKVRLKEIFYIESLNNYVKIYTAHASYLVLHSLKAIAEKLPAEGFIRIHRSYIVATDKLAFVQFRKVGLTNRVELPVGDTFRAGLAGIKPPSRLPAQ